MRVLRDQPQPMPRGRHYRRGTLIPTLPDQLLQIQAGIVAQMVIHTDGTEVLLGLHGAGQLLLPHPADSCFLHLQAQTEVLLVPISWQEARQWPDLPEQLRGRLWQQEAWAAMQARPHLADRILGLLELLAEQFGRTQPDGVLIDVRITHQQLAAASGATRTTVTRILQELRRRAVLDVVGQGQQERFCLLGRQTHPSHTGQG